MASPELKLAVEDRRLDAEMSNGPIINNNGGQEKKRWTGQEKKREQTGRS